MQNDSTRRGFLKKGSVAASGAALSSSIARSAHAAGSDLVRLALVGCGGRGQYVVRGMIEQGAGPERSGFLSAFFTLVGTHGLHVSVGLLWICVMIGQVFFKGLTAPVASRLMRLGLFWHFLDIIWVVIFSVVYLPGVL